MLMHEMLKRDFMGYRRFYILMINSIMFFMAMALYLAVNVFLVEWLV